MIMVLAFSTAVTAATNVIDENFETSDEISGYGIKLSGGTAEVRKSADGAKEIKVLNLTDVSGDEGITLYKSFDKIEGMAAVEVKFRYSASMNNFSISIGEGSGVTKESTGEPF